MVKDDAPHAVVLVADDEPSMLSLIAQHVRTLGHEVFVAHDGEEAWQQARARTPDLVLLDVMMPAMSGWEVCRKIREEAALSHTGVIMITGIGEKLNELTSPLFGADAYLDKPFELGDLDVAIHEVLAKKRHSTSNGAKKADGKHEGGAKATKKPADDKPAKKVSAKGGAPAKPAKKAAAKGAR